MKALECGIPCKLDREVSKILKAFMGDVTSKKVTFLRTAYNNNHPKNPIEISDTELKSKSSEEIEQLAYDVAKKILGEEVVNLEFEKAKEKLERIETLKDLPKAANKHRAAIGKNSKLKSSNVNARVTLIVDSIIDVVNSLCEKYPEISRKDILNGTIKQGKHSLGMFKILEMVRQKLAREFSNRGEYERNQINILLDNNVWNALVPIALKKLSTLEEDLKLNTGKIVVDYDTEGIDFNDLSETINSEESGREHYNVVSAMIDPDKSAPALVRSILYNIRQGDTTSDDLGHLNAPNIIERMAHLREICRGCRNSEQMVELIEKSTLSYKEELLNILKKDPKIRTLFFKGLKKSSVEYASVKIKDTLNKTKRMFTQVLNRGTSKTFNRFKSEIIKNGIYYNSSSVFHVFNRDGKLDKQNLEKLDSYIDDFFKINKITEDVEGMPFPITKTIRGKWYTNSMKIEDKVNVVQTIIQSLGIKISNETIERIISEGKVYELKDAIIDFINHLKNNENLNIIDHLTEYNDAFINTSKKFEKILSIIDRYNNVTLSRSVRTKNSKGKTITMFSDVNTSYLTNLYDDISMYLKTENYSGLREYLEVKFFSSNQYAVYEDDPTNPNNKKLIILNTWLKDLYENCDKPEYDKEQWKIKRVLTVSDSVAEDAYTRDLHISDFAAFYTSTKKVKEIAITTFEYEKKRGKLNSDYNYIVKDKENKKTKYYYNNGDWTAESSEYAEYPLFTLGDNGALYYIKQKKLDRSQIEEGLYNMFLSEMQRMKNIRLANKKLGARKGADGKYIGGINNINDREYQFTALPFLNNPKYFNIIFEGTTLEDYVNNDDLSIPGLKDRVKRAVSEYIEDSVIEYENKLNKDKFLEKNENNKYTYLDEYIQKIIPEANKLSEQEYEDAKHDLIFDFVANNIFANTQQFQINIVDPGFFKNTEDLQKRYKAMMASGTALDVKATWKNENGEDELVAGVDGIETCIYIKDPVTSGYTTNPEFMEALAYQYGQYTEEYINWESKNKEVPEEIKTAKKIEYGKNLGIIKKYSENPTADGQGWRSLKGYRKVMIMSGQWSDNKENLYRKILKYRQTKDYELLTEIRKSAIVFQPIKPLLMDVEDYKLDNGNILKIPVFHKYAEIPLIPELLPENSALKTIAEYMEDNDIDMCGVWSTGGDTIVKTGGFGAVDIQDVLKINNKEKLRDRLGLAYPHKLHYENYIIQTNVPNHSIDFRAVGTQIRKLITAGIISNKIYDYFPVNKIKIFEEEQGVSPTGDQLVAFYNSLIVSNIIDSLEDSIKNLGSANSQKISEILTTMKYANGRSDIDSIIYGLTLDDDGNFNIPLFEGFSEFDNASSLISYFKNNVLKQKMLGGSAVQASSFGIYDYQESGNLKYEVYENHNILWAECEMPWDLFFTDSEGNRHNLNFEDWCNEDGTLIMENGNPKIEKYYPGILDMIAYRVPTEQEYSTMNLKIVRFSRPTLGGVIKVPAPAVTTAGFDFDIDKLYFLRKEFSLNSKSTKTLLKNLHNDNFVKDRWEDVYSSNINNINIKEALEAAKYSFSMEEQKEIGEELYKYWEYADLPGTAQSYFDREVEHWVRDNIKEWDEYDYTKIAHGQSRVAKNNALFTLMRSRLMDPETFFRRTTPGGFPTATKIAKLMRIIDSEDVQSNTTLEECRDKIGEDKDYKTNYSPIDPYTRVVYNQQNQIAGKVIGIFADHNTAYFYSTLAYEFKLETSRGVAFGKHHNNPKIDLLNKENFRTVSGILAEFLNSSVDAVKDPVLKYLNINTLTANIAATLARLGYDLEDIGLFLNQPIIKDICDLAFTDQIPLNTATNEISRAKYKNVNLSNVDGITLDTKSLYNAIRDNKFNRYDKNPNSKQLKQQIQILEVFKNLLEVSTIVAQMNRAIKNTASNSVSSSWGGFLAKSLQLISLYEKIQNAGFNFKKSEFGISNNDLPMDLNMWELLNSNSSKYCMDTNILRNPWAFEQCMGDAFKVFMYKLAQKQFPYLTAPYNISRGILNRALKYGTLSEEHINNLHRELPVWYISGISISTFNPDGKCTIDIKYDTGDKVTISNKFFYTSVFPKILESVMENSLFAEDAPNLVNNLEIIRGKNGFLIKINGESMMDSIKAELSDLILSEEAEEGIEVTAYESYGDEISKVKYIINMSHADIAKGLFFNTFFTNGFNTSLLSKYLPNVMLGNIKLSNDKDSYLYTDILKLFRDNSFAGVSAYDMMPFIKMFILNHSEDKSLVYSPRGTTKTNIKDQLSKTNNTYFKVQVNLDLYNNNKSNDPMRDLLNNTEFGIDGSVMSVDYVPCINIDGHLFMADSNVSSDSQAYKLINSKDRTTKVIYDNSSSLFFSKDTNSNMNTMYYVAVDKLGDDKKTMSYVANNSSSVIDEVINQELEMITPDSDNTDTGESTVQEVQYQINIEKVKQEIERKGIPLNEITIKEICDTIHRIAKGKRIATYKDGIHVIVKDENGETLELC